MFAVSKDGGACEERDALALAKAKQPPIQII